MGTEKARIRAVNQISRAPSNEVTRLWPNDRPKGEIARFRASQEEIKGDLT